MFATPAAASRIATICLFLLVLAFCVDVSHASAASPPGWQATGSTTPSWSAEASATQNTEWRLPSGHARAVPHSANRNSNSLRPNQVTAAPPREPRILAPPAGATPLSPLQRALGSAATATPQRHTPSAAISQTSAAVPAGPPSQSAARPAPSYRAPNPTPRIARTTPVMRGGSSPSSPRTWQRMNLAMQGNDELSGEVENLPLPEDAGPREQDPFLSHPGPNDNHFSGDGYYPSCGPDGCGDTCGCGDGVCEPGCGCGGKQCECGDECCNDCLCIGPGDPESCHTVRMRVPKWQELHFIGGVQGFKGPYDQTRDSGNFGFHEGFNAGFKIPYTYAGYQIGYQAAQSQLNGSENDDINESHTQHFTTFGLFRRTKDGLQFGAAWDMLRDQRFEAFDFHQIRSEISWMDCGRHEFGFSATLGLNEYETENLETEEDTSWQAADQYLLFYRFHGCNGGEGRFYAGASDDSDGIIGADMLLPVHDRWSVQTGFTYLIPDAPNGIEGARAEAWNIGLAMVWHWGCTARKSHCNPYRPLFNVANNGYLIVDGRPIEEGGNDGG